MICKDKLRKLLKENKLSFKDLSDILGISYSSLMNKLSTGYLRSNEIEAIIAIFGLTAQEYEPIFFSELHKHKPVF